jgi:hypothetical protein
MVPVLSDCARFLRLGAWVSGAVAESKTPE